MRDKKIFNFLEFLEELKKGEVCLREFAEKRNLSVRSVQRYKNEVEEFFNVKLILTKRGCYTFPNPQRIDDFMLKKSDLEEFKKLSYILNLINPKLLKFLKIDERVIKRFVDDKIFLIKESPIEELNNIDIELIQKAIKRRYCLDIDYFSDKKYSFKDAKPLKIIFSEGNWYLAALTDDEINNGFKFLRLNYIKKITLKKDKEFKIPAEAKEFLDNFQTLFSRYKEPFFEVLVEVDS